MNATSIAKPVMLPRAHGRPTRLCASLLIITFLSSCVAIPTNRATSSKVKDSYTLEWVAQLKEASTQHPEIKAYRVDYLRERERAVNTTLLNASNALNKGSLDEAETLYSSVLTTDAENAQAKLGLIEIDRYRRRLAAIIAAQEAISRDDFEAAHNALQGVLIESPNDKEALDLSRQIDKARYTTESLNQIPEMSAAYKKPISLQFKDANLRMIFEAISRTTGLNILIDKDLKADLKATVFVKQATVEDTISLILLQNQLEKKIINDNTLYIYPATPSKLKEHQDLIIRTFQLTNADAKQMQVLLKTMIKAKDVFINEKSNSLVMRDTPEAVALAAKLIAAQDVNEPEVMLEMEVLEVSSSLLTQIGIDYPDRVSFTVGGTRDTFNPVTGITTTNPVTQTLDSLRRINKSQIFVSPTLGITLNLKKTDGEINTLANPRIRVRQREKAKILIGSRYPIITNTVTPSTGTPVVTGSIQYIDLGLKLEVEPDIHIDGEVGIKTGLEVSSLGEIVFSGKGTAGETQAPVINTRTVNTVLRLKDGETQVLAGLINNEERESANKVPGLGDIPILGRLFSNHGRNKNKTELILAITPRIIRNILQPDADIASYWSGTDTSVRSRPITVQKIQSISMDNKAPSLLPNESNVSLQPSAIQASEALPNARQPSARQPSARQPSAKQSSSKQINQRQANPTQPSTTQSSATQSSANAQPSRNLQPALEDQAIDIDSILNDTSSPVNRIIVPSTGLVIEPTDADAAAIANGASATTQAAPPAPQKGPASSTTSNGAPYVVPRGAVNPNGTGSTGSVITPGLPLQ